MDNQGGTAYCQMIRETNKVKRLSWAREHLHEAKQGFLDVIFTDETSIQMESHRRYCCRKKGEPPVYKPRYSTFLALCYVYVCVLSLKIDLASHTRYVKLLSVQPWLLHRLCMSESKTCCFRDFSFTYCTQCIKIASHNYYCATNPLAPYIFAELLSICV